MAVVFITFASILLISLAMVFAPGLTRSFGFKKLASRFGLSYHWGKHFPYGFTELDCHWNIINGTIGNHKIEFKDLAIRSGLLGSNRGRRILNSVLTVDGKTTVYKKKFFRLYPVSIETISKALEDLKNQ
jgi:hypothetical protein